MSLAGLKELMGQTVPPRRPRERNPDNPAADILRQVELLPIYERDGCDAVLSALDQTRVYGTAPPRPDLSSDPSTSIH